MLRLKGDLAHWQFGSDAAAEAEALFRQSIGVATAQEAKLWQLRSSVSLARLCAEKGERRQAHDLLAPVHGWFTEGFDTPDLVEARALLDELT